MPARRQAGVTTQGQSIIYSLGTGAACRGLSALCPHEPALLRGSSFQRLMKLSPWAQLSSWPLAAQSLRTPRRCHGRGRAHHQRGLCASGISSLYKRLASSQVIHIIWPPMNPYPPCLISTRIQQNREEPWRSEQRMLLLARVCAHCHSPPESCSQLQTPLSCTAAARVKTSKQTLAPVSCPFLPCSCVNVLKALLGKQVRRMFRFF